MSSLVVVQIINMEKRENVEERERKKNVALLLVVRFRRSNSFEELGSRPILKITRLARINYIHAYTWETIN